MLSSEYSRKVRYERRRPFIIHGRVATPQEARDIRNPMIQLFCFSSSGLIGRRV
jgi:hypothetical protein